MISSLQLYLGYRMIRPGDEEKELLIWEALVSFAGILQLILIDYSARASSAAPP